MTESASLPMNFGGIAEEEFSSLENWRILVWPIGYESICRTAANELDPAPLERNDHAAPNGDGKSN